MYSWKRWEIFSRLVGIRQASLIGCGRGEEAQDKLCTASSYKKNKIKNHITVNCSIRGSEFIQRNFCVFIYLWPLLDIRISTFLFCVYWTTTVSTKIFSQNNLHCDLTFQAGLLLYTSYTTNSPTH